MKKILGAVTLLAVIAAAVLWFGPAFVERRMNRVRGLAPEVPESARQMHRRLLIVDLHADTLLWQRDLLTRSDRGHLDVPRLIEGNVALQAFTVVNRAPRNLNMIRNDNSSDMLMPLTILQMWPVATWTSPKQRALYEAERFGRAASKSRGQLVWIKSASDLTSYLERRRNEPMLTAGFLGVEGADALEGDLANLQPFFGAGFRMLSLTHFTDTLFAGSSTGTDKRGLTPLGRRLIKEMEARQMIVDLAHASPQTVDDVLEIATRPMLVSHTGVTATCDSNRNLSDDRIARVAEKGGLIGIAYFQAAVCGTDVGAIARAIRHVTGLVGVEHAALGSDFDGNTTMPFDVSGLASITAALLSNGFTENEIAKIMGENALHFLAENLPR